MQSTGRTADALLRRAKLYIRAGQTADAVYYLRRFLASPDCVWADERCEAMLALARCHLQTDNRTEAERWFLRACAETPDRPEPWRAAAAFYEALLPPAAALCRARAEMLLR